MSYTVRNRLKFGKIVQEDLLCTKMQKKNGYREFDHSSTLSNLSASPQIGEAFLAPSKLLKIAKLSTQAI